MSDESPDVEGIETVSPFWHHEPTQESDESPDVEGIETKRTLRKCGLVRQMRRPKLNEQKSDLYRSVLIKSSQKPRQMNLVTQQQKSGLINPL
jgi:hypothetical protein